MAEFRTYLPSRHFIKVTLICAAVIAVAIFGTKAVAHIRNKAAERKIIAETQADQYNGSLVAITDLAETDTDKDGIPDWEESLWGTDPDKADTDGDGTTDKEEIDAKKAAIEEKNTASTANDATLSETESFSRELFASIAALKESGNLNNQSIQDLAQTISENAGDKQTLADRYTADAVTIEADSPENTKQYHDALLALLKKYDTTAIGTELAIIDESLSAQDKDTIGDLHPIAKAYKDLASDLMAMKVPKEAVSMHLALANHANNIFTALENVTQIFDNALGGLIGISQYQTESDEFDQALQNVKDYFTQSGILSS